MGKEISARDKYLKEDVDFDLVKGVRIGRRNVSWHFVVLWSIGKES